VSNEVKLPLALKKAAPEAPAGPVRKAFSVERGQGGWRLITVTHCDGKIVSVEESQPDLKPIILEAFKIAAFKHWNTQ
jgi:hypothetical protein